MRDKTPPPTVVLLVRHGLTPTTGKDLPAPGPGPSLSEEGRRQAEETAQHLASLRAGLPPLGAIYTSPLVRTRETAAIVGKLLDRTPVEREGLADCDVGEWAGASLRQLARKPEWPSVLHYPSGFQFPGGETMTGMQFRVVSTVRELRALHPGQSIVVVSHADPIKALLAEALGLHLDLFQRIDVSPASVSAIAYGSSGSSGSSVPRVMFANWAPSLLPVLPPKQGSSSSQGRLGHQGQSQ